MVFLAVFNLSSLNGQNGFVINTFNGAGSNQEEFFVSGAGDINADGIDDIIIGAPNTEGNEGQSYVIYGNRNGFPLHLNVTDLNGQNGFTIGDIGEYVYAAQDGWSVSSAGDINADGIDDIILGARGGGVIGSGEAYVIFGSKYEFPSFIDSSWLNGKQGFQIYGITKHDCMGCAVSKAGDINADGIEDIVIGANDANGFAGQSYVIFGSKYSFPSIFNISSLNGMNGFTLNGINGMSGSDVSNAGDINYDGIDDIIIGAGEANGFAGQSYVVFGTRNGFVPEFNLTNLNGQNGFIVNPIVYNPCSQFFGNSISAAGDINYDGINDIILSAGNYWSGGSCCASGVAYIIFGNRNGFVNEFNLTNLNGQNGFMVNGIDGCWQNSGGGFSSWGGGAVSNLGDVNADGIDDIIIGAFGVNNFTGQSYVIFGSKYEFPATINSSWLNGQNGFLINGIDIGDNSGWTVGAAGDVNDDGINDIVIGAPQNGVTGQTYIIFGQSSSFSDNQDI
jgi:hypothetical protein